ncbi:MAG: hypothetical protein KDM91_22530 [Verrucomicrobiae bacterium]|nr:hypothetical protein [Verrucomicrobiae bacterium]
MSTNILLLKLGGLMHFGILIASALAPAALNWRENLAPLPKLLRQMFWVYGAFIVLTIVGFGTLTLFQAERLAAGDSLGRGFCALVALFWAARLGVQFFVFDAKPWLTRPLYRWGYHGLTAVFVALVAIYGRAALGVG